MGDYFHPRDLIVGLAIKHQPDGDLYVWAFKCGNRIEYVDHKLSYFGGNRNALCRHSLYDVIDSVNDTEGACPRAIYIYRETDFDNMGHLFVASEYGGIQLAIQDFYLHRPDPNPRHAFVTVTSGTLHWADFVLAGGNAAHDYNSSYWVVGPNPGLGLISMEYLEGLTHAYSFTTGFVRVCWKATFYTHMQSLRSWAIRVIQDQAAGMAHNDALQLLHGLDILIHTP